MRRFIRPASLALGLFAATVLSTSCADSRTTSPTAAAPVAPVVSLSGGSMIASAQLPSVRISEFHYDNASTDVDEKIEISGPAGTSLSGWSLVLYNGSATVRAPYTTTSLTGMTIPATEACGSRGVIVISYPTNGIQNGSSSQTGTDPDGIALVNGTTVIEFMSYEGSFVAASGVAAGMTSTDIGIRELGTESASPVSSLKRDGAGVWSGPSLNSFGTCNDQDEPPPPQDVDRVTVAPASATVTLGATQQFIATAFDAADQPIVGTTFNWSSSDALTASVDGSGLASTVKTGEVTITATAPNSVSNTATLRIEEATPPSLPETRFSEIHYDNSGTDANEAIEVEGPGGTDLTDWTIVLYDGTGSTMYNTASISSSITARCDGRGVIVLNYPTNGIQNGGPDGFALVNGAGQVVEFLSYEGTFTATDGPAAGRASVDIGVSESSSTTAQQSLQRNADGAWAAPSTSTFGRCNSEGPPPPENSISFSGRLPTDPGLPVGFEDQLFATERDGSTNAVITTTFTWSSETPSIASIDANGVMHALAEGAATFRATATDGTTATYSLPMVVATASTTAQYANNTEFGDPTDADASNDFIIRRPQFVSSYNSTRSTPNWVAYNLDATHFGTQVDRCDCFTHDPMLPAEYAHLTTASYTGAGAAAGYGIDRGHLARSFDRTSAPLDNAFTYYFSNIIPQASDNNQGPWANMENYLGDLARNQNKEVYIIAGVAGSKGTVKNEGIIVIPAQVWKIAVVMSRDQGLGDVQSASDLEIIAAIMPNDPEIRSVDWRQSYVTTVDAVEALSGYDLLALLSDQIEIALESNTKPPVAQTNGPYASVEGATVSMSGAGSTDPDGDALAYAWTFGDGQSGSGVAVTHSYAQNGTYTVQLTVTDVRGLFAVTTTTAAVTNVAPTIAPFAGAILLPGETYSASGSFTDPGADAWSATVNYGDGSGTNALSLSGAKTFALAHTYETAGSFTVTVEVSDDDATSSRMQGVTVLTPAAAVGNVMALCEAFNSLTSKLEAAIKQLENGKTTPAVNQLQAFLHEVDAMVRSGRITLAQAEQLRVEVDRVIRSVTR